MSVHTDSAQSQFWDKARIWNLEHREPSLKRFCTAAHEQAGFGTPGRANYTSVKPRKLTFANPAYKSRMVDILMYGINGFTQPRADKWFFWLLRDDCWYMTEAESDECVYYVTHANRANHEFKLVKHVCGIRVNLTFDRTVPHYI